MEGNWPVYIFILAHTTLKMATWVAETCRWSLCNINCHHKTKVRLLISLINVMHWTLHISTRLTLVSPFISGGLQNVKVRYCRMVRVKIPKVTRLNSKMSHPRCVYINNRCGYQSITQQYLLLLCYWLIPTPIEHAWTSDKSNIKVHTIIVPRIVKRNRFRQTAKQGRYPIKFTSWWQWDRKNSMC